MELFSTIAFIVISLGLRPDERQSSVIPASSEASVGLKKIDKAMQGVERSSVQLEWDESVPNDSPEIVQVIKKVDEVLNSEELIGHPLSILKLIDSMPGEGKPEDRMSMLELLPPSLKRAFYTPERREANVSFRVQDLGIASYDPVFKRIQSGLEQIVEAHPEFNLYLDGDAVWRWENLFQIVVDLAASLGTAVFIIFVVLAFVYRSVRIGIDFVDPKPVSFGRFWSLSLPDRSSARSRNRLRIYCMSRNCRRRYDPFPHPLPGRTQGNR